MNSDKKQTTDTVLILLAIMLLFGAGALVSNDRLLYRYFNSFDGERGQTIGEISSAQSDVRHRYHGDLQWFPVFKKDLLFNKDFIFTGDDSAASVTLDDHSQVIIYPDSLVSLRMTPQGLEVNASSGSVITKAPPGKKIIFRSSAGNLKTIVSSGGQFKFDSLNAQVSALKTAPLMISTKTGSEKPTTDDTANLMSYALHDVAPVPQTEPVNLAQTPAAPHPAAPAPQNTYASTALPVENKPAKMPVRQREEAVIPFEEDKAVPKLQRPRRQLATTSMPIKKQMPVKRPVVKVAQHPLQKPAPPQPMRKVASADDLKEQTPSSLSKISTTLKPPVHQNQITKVFSEVEADLGIVQRDNFGNSYMGGASGSIWLASTPEWADSSEQRLRASDLQPHWGFGLSETTSLVSGTDPYGNSLSMSEFDADLMWRVRNTAWHSGFNFGFLAGYDAYQYRGYNINSMDVGAFIDISTRFFQTAHSVHNQLLRLSARDFLVPAGSSSTFTGFNGLLGLEEKVYFIGDSYLQVGAQEQIRNFIPDPSTGFVLQSTGILLTGSVGLDF